jgi:hypothetical protein
VKKPGKAPATKKTDTLGYPIEVPRGHRFVIGKNGKGISLAPGERKAEDRHGQAYALPIGGRSKENPDGTLTILRYGEHPKRKKPLSQREAIKLTEDMAESEEAKRNIL